MSPDKGAKVIAEARKQLGAHYIHGGYGATPGRDDGFPTADRRRIELIFDDLRMDPRNVYGERNSIAVLAASTEINRYKNNKLVDSKYSVCGGNYDIGGKKGLSESDLEVEDTIRLLQRASFGQYSAVLPRLTPRRVFGPRPVGASTGELVLGEVCANVRHFDCVGFISYCIWAATGKIIQLDIPEWVKVPGVLSATVFDLKDNKRPEKLLDGDIAVKGTHHIALVGTDGTLYEAQDTNYGVRNNGRLTLGVDTGWTHLVRLPDASLR